MCDPGASARSPIAAFAKRPTESLFRAPLRVWYFGMSAIELFFIDSGASLTFLSRTLARGLKIPLDPTQAYLAATAAGPMDVVSSVVKIDLGDSSQFMRCCVPTEQEGFNLLSVPQLALHGLRICLDAEWARFYR
jgi:hypothetical protein